MHCPRYVAAGAGAVLNDIERELGTHETTKDGFVLNVLMWKKKAGSKARTRKARRPRQDAFSDERSETSRQIDATKAKESSQ